MGTPIPISQFGYDSPVAVCLPCTIILKDDEEPVVPYAEVLSWIGSRPYQEALPSGSSVWSCNTSLSGVSNVVAGCTYNYPYFAAPATPFPQHIVCSIHTALSNLSMVISSMLSSPRLRPPGDEPKRTKSLSRSKTFKPPKKRMQRQGRRTRALPCRCKIVVQKRSE